VTRWIAAQIYRSFEHSPLVTFGCFLGIIKELYIMPPFPGNLLEVLEKGYGRAV